MLRYIRDNKTLGLKYYADMNDATVTDLLRESGSEFSHFIPEPINFAEVTKLSENIRKPWLKATLKEIKNLINNQTLLIDYQKEGEPVTPCMDIYKAKI